MKQLNLIHLAPSDRHKSGIASYADIIDQIFSKYLSHEVTVHRVNENNYLNVLRECKGEVVVLAQIGSNEGTIFRVLLQQRRVYPDIRRMIEIHDPPYFVLSYKLFLEKIARWLPGRIFRRLFHLVLGTYYIKALISPNDVFICKTAIGADVLKLKLSRMGIHAPVFNIAVPNYLDPPLIKGKSGFNLPCVGFFGYIHPDKGVHVLVEAAIQLANSKGVECVPLIKIRGAVAAPHYLKYLDSLKCKVEAAGLVERVIFGGFIPFEELPAFVNELTAVALPYMVETRSSASGPLLWARTCGVPVLAHRTLVFEANVQNEIDGLLIPINDIECWASVLERIVKQPLWSDKFKTGVLHSQLESSWEVISDRYRQMLFVKDC